MLETHKMGHRHESSISADFVPLNSAPSGLSTLHSRIRSKQKDGGDDIDWTPFVARHVRNLYEKRDGAVLSQAKIYEKPFMVIAMADISG